MHPDRIVMNYPKMMLSALFVNPAPRSMLIIGLGGGTLPRTLRQVVPDTQIDVVEIDPAVVRVARRYFGFVAGDKARSRSRATVASSSSARYAAGVATT